MLYSQNKNLVFFYTGWENMSVLMQNSQKV